MEDWRDTGLIWQVFDLEKSARFMGRGEWSRSIVNVLCSRFPKPGDTIRFRWDGGTVRARVRSVCGRDLVKSVHIDEGIADSLAAPV